MEKVAIVLLILALVASSVTLWLLESPLAPMLYFFAVTLILTTYHSLSGNFKKNKIEPKGKKV